METAAALCRLVFEARRTAQLLESLLDIAQRQAAAAKRALYGTAREEPVHGRLAWLRRCLCGDGDQRLTPKVVDKCVVLLQDVADTMLKALAGHRQDEHAVTSPSFRLWARRWSLVADPHRLRRILTGCRHKGAIESARLAWSRLSTTALRHDSSAVLRGVLAELRAGGARSSVTRSGAGLPMLVHTLLTAESRRRAAW